jgi:spore germination protein YaaH
MISDFTKVVPVEKITVIFGLFGYDWQVDRQGHTVAQAKALTLREIEKNFIDNCTYRSCTFSRDSVSLETEIHYRDNGGRYHIVWFEDMDSIAAKKGFLKSRGVGNFVYWAHSYF